MLKISKSLLILLLLTLSIAGCKKDDPDYEVPTTYNFKNVNYAGQKDRLKMLDELVTYMKSANSSGVVLDAQVLNNMFTNTNDPFTFTSTRQLRDKCFLAEVSNIESWFDSLAIASQSVVAGSDGVAGVVLSNDGSKQYLCSATGKDYTQVITKTLMGAILYYQAAGVYLTDAKIGDGVDNEIVVDGEGTAREHHWDEAFGYFGVPLDFPTNLNGLMFIGEYADERNAVLDCSLPIMKAFLKGRAALSANDSKTRDEQAVLVKEWWEKIIAASAIHYLNNAKSHISDDALRNHELSECFGFVRSLKYSPVKKITDTQIQTVLDYLGDNFYLVSVSDLDSAKDLISSVYGMDAIKNTL